MISLYGKKPTGMNCRESAVLLVSQAVFESSEEAKYFIHRVVTNKFTFLRSSVKVTPLQSKTKYIRCCYSVECVHCSVMSDSLRPHCLCPPGSSVHGILQARILEELVIPFSSGSYWPRDRIWVSHTAGRFFIIWDTTSTLSAQHNGNNCCYFVAKLCPTVLPHQL